MAHQSAGQTGLPGNGGETYHLHAPGEMPKYHILCLQGQPNHAGGHVPGFSGLLKRNSSAAN